MARPERPADPRAGPVRRLGYELRPVPAHGPVVPKGRKPVSGLRPFGPPRIEGVVQDVVPITAPPDLVTWYVTLAPLQKWKVRFTRAPSRSESRNSCVSVMPLPV